MQRIVQRLAGGVGEHPGQGDKDHRQPAESQRDEVHQEETLGLLGMPEEIRVGEALGRGAIPGPGPCLRPVPQRARRGDLFEPALCPPRDADEGTDGHQEQEQADGDADPLLNDEHLDPVL